ncbi:uncharacterized protein LOC122566124 [Bombus pyrosoma]|uniref:uncharacterized protein LOC122566124 n=1 Tax=Bombus pyrosoma TaxID=396416 RepID=UPI001CB9C8A0|nr:uncharacterized protein LOC122566124 [Bombus pyrosoma]
MGQDSDGPGTLRSSQLPRSADPRLPRRQVGILRQQGRTGKAARRARRTAGFGVGADLVDHRVLRCPLPPGVAMVCYADDTLVLVGSRGWHEMLRMGEVATACAILPVRGLGLRVSPMKSEAIWFYDKNRRGAPPPGLSISMERETVEVGSRMRYLGLDIDSQWTFEPHFDFLIPRATAAANALCGLLPNIGGAGVAVRRLYEGVVRTRVMYGVPVWADDLMASRRSILLLRRLHRNPFIDNEDYEFELTTIEKEKLVELSCGSSLKQKFQNQTLIQFWMNLSGGMNLCITKQCKCFYRL